MGVGRVKVILIILFVSFDQIDVFPTYLKSKCRQQKAKVLKSFDRVSLLVKEANEALAIELDQFSWGWFTVNTRAVYFDNKSRNEGNYFPNGCDLEENENLALAPFLDMFNHSSQADVNVGPNLIMDDSNVAANGTAESWNIFEADKSNKGKTYQIITNTEYKKYEQVFINYGPHGNIRLFMDYGFIEANNPNDFVFQNVIYTGCISSSSRTTASNKSMLLCSQDENQVCSEGIFSYNVNTKRPCEFCQFNLPLSEYIKNDVFDW